MNFLPQSVSYPESEQPKLSELGTLFEAWHQYFSEHLPASESPPADDMVFDGFYPYYFSQKRKILFIGREARQIAACNYLDTLLDVYRRGKLIGARSLDSDAFHSRMIHIAHGVMSGMPAWQDIPWASEIGNTFGEASGLSFAFMNVSKLSNESEHFASDYEAIDMAYRLSTESRNFIREEIRILEPDIVITMNLGDYLNALGDRVLTYKSGPANSYRLDVSGHPCLLIDTWHFANWTKGDIEDFYRPICEAIARGV